MTQQSLNNILYIIQIETMKFTTEQIFDLTNSQSDLIDKVIIWQRLKVEEYMKMRIKDKSKRMP